MKRSLVCLLLIPFLSGCGGSSDSGAEASGGKYRTIQDVRDALTKGGIDCSGYEQDKEVIGAKEKGSCTVGEDSVEIDIFQSHEQMVQLLEATQALQSGFQVKGDVWLVVVPTDELAQKVQDAVGGEVA